MFWSEKPTSLFNSIQSCLLLYHTFAIKKGTISTAHLHHHVPHFSFLIKKNPNRKVSLYKVRDSICHFSWKILYRILKYQLLNRKFVRVLGILGSLSWSWEQRQVNWVVYCVIQSSFHFFFLFYFILFFVWKTCKLHWI